MLKKELIEPGSCTVLLVLPLQIEKNSLSEISSSFIILKGLDILSHLNVVIIERKGFSKSKFCHRTCENGRAKKKCTIVTSQSGLLSQSNHSYYCCHIFIIIIAGVSGNYHKVATKFLNPVRNIYSELNF